MTVVKSEEGEEFKWVSYQAVINDLPILQIKNKQVIARHFDKLVNSGIMKKYVHQKMGVYTCFKLTEKYRVLIEKYTPIDSKVNTPIDSKVETKDSSIKLDSSIKNNKKIDYEESFNIFYKLYNLPINKLKSQIEWKKIDPDIYTEIYKHVKEYRSRGQGVEFPLNPNNYLKNKRWTEVIIETFKNKNLDNNKSSGTEGKKITWGNWDASK